jgi:hypothetical protein
MACSWTVKTSGLALTAMPCRPCNPRCWNASLHRFQQVLINFAHIAGLSSWLQQLYADSKPEPASPVASSPSAEVRLKSLPEGWRRSPVLRYVAEELASIRATLAGAEEAVQRLGWPCSPGSPQSAAELQRAIANTGGPRRWPILRAQHWAETGLVPAERILSVQIMYSLVAAGCGAAEGGAAEGSAAEGGAAEGGAAEGGAAEGGAAEGGAAEGGAAEGGAADAFESNQHGSAPRMLQRLQPGPSGGRSCAGGSVADLLRTKGVAELVSFSVTALCVTRRPDAAQAAAAVLMLLGQGSPGGGLQPTNLQERLGQEAAGAGAGRIAGALLACALLACRSVVL